MFSDAACGRPSRHRRKAQWPSRFSSGSSRLCGRPHLPRPDRVVERRLHRQPAEWQGCLCRGPGLREGAEGTHGFGFAEPRPVWSSSGSLTSRTTVPSASSTRSVYVGGSVSRLMRR